MNQLTTDIIDASVKSKVLWKYLTHAFRKSGEYAAYDWIDGT